MFRNRPLAAAALATCLATPAFAQINFTDTQLVETDPENVLDLVNTTQTIDTTNGLDLTGLTYLTPTLTPGTSVSASLTATRSFNTGALPFFGKVNAAAKVKLINAGGDDAVPVVDVDVTFDVIEVDRGVVLTSLAETRSTSLTGNGFTTLEFNNVSSNFALAPTVDYALRIVYDLTVTLPDNGPLDDTPTVVVVSEFFGNTDASPFSATITGFVLPEPSSAALLAAGVGLLACRRRA
ncbi:MAG: hypothetical protein AAGI54_01735 [Planctomycetota bacterium]